MGRDFTAVRGTYQARGIYNGTSKEELYNPGLEVRYTGTFHDRFLIIDNEKAYHIGASLKDAGKRCFAISLLSDKNVMKDILQRLELETEEIATHGHHRNGGRHDI